MLQQLAVVLFLVGPQNEDLHLLTVLVLEYRKPPKVISVNFNLAS